MEKAGPQLHKAKEREPELLMIKNGIDRIKISVHDMAGTLAFFRDTLEMVVAAEASLDAAAFQQLWRLPQGTSAHAVFLQNQEQTTLIELISVSPNSGRLIRRDANNYDYGLFDVAFRARDIDAIYADFKRRGIEFLSPPVVYHASWVNVMVKEVILIGPNRMPIALIERLTEPKPLIRNRFGTMVDCAQFVPSMEEAVDFYTRILGYTTFFNQDLPDGMIDELLTLPPGNRSRMAFLIQAGTQAPAVELINVSATGNSLAAVAGPTRFGLFALALETGDLSALLAKIGAAGYRVFGGPIDMEAGVRGRVKAAVIQGPAQVLLEIFEKQPGDFKEG